MPIEFVIQLKDLKVALTKGSVCFRRQGLGSKTDYVDVKVGIEEVSFVGSGFGHMCPAKVRTGGYGRVPYPLINNVRLMLRTLRDESIPISAIQTVKNQAGRPACAQSANKYIRSASAALDGLSDAPLSTFRFGSSPAGDR
jgi:hypothetical protein